MIKPRKRKDGTTAYDVYMKAGGKKVYKRSFDSKREARDYEEDQRVLGRQIARGELPPEVNTERTLKQATDEWLAALGKRGSRSLRVNREFLKYQVLPHLGGVPIAKLTKARIIAWRDERATEYAPTSVNSALAVLSSACSEFVDRGWLNANPCSGVDQVKVPPRAYNWIRTRPELQRLLMNCADELRDMVAVAVGTGMRQDAMLHLQWDDVDLEARLITLQRGKQGSTKSGKIHHVPILDSLLPVLKRRALRRGGATLVFPGKKGKVRHPTSVRVAFKTALRRAGLDTKLRWHDLRHTMASWWVMSGGDIFRLSKVLGHSNVQITQRTYAHLAPEAWQQDYHRVAFDVPAEPAKIVELVRDDRGRLAGRRAITTAISAA